MSLDVSKIFSSKKSIILDRLALEPDSMYHPPAIHHRDEQLSDLAHILSDAAQGIKPNNILTYGTTGTGKTLCINYITGELLKHNNRVNVVYVNLKNISTEFSGLRTIVNALPGGSIKHRGISTDEAYEAMWANLQTMPGIVIIVLDEINNLEDNASNILYSLLRFPPTKFPNIQVSIIGISNSIKFKEYLDPTVVSSLGEKSIIFPPYNAEQLVDILTERAKAIRDGSLEEGVIQLCAAIAAQESGDARLAIQLLRDAAILAQKEGLNKVEIDHVKLAKNEGEDDRISKLIIGLPVQTRAVIYSIYILHTISKIQSPSTQEIYNQYQTLIKMTSMDQLTQRRISDYISELEMLEIISSTIKYKGRYGRVKNTALSIDHDIVKKLILSDFTFKYHLSDILRSKQGIQSTIQ